MPKKCWAALCDTGTKRGSIRCGQAGLQKPSVFKVTEKRLLEWRKYVPKKRGRELKVGDCICSRHFSEEDIVRSFSLKMPDGSTYTVPKLELRPGARPWKFDGAPYHSSKRPPKRSYKDPTLQRQSVIKKNKITRKNESTQQYDSNVQQEEIDISSDTQQGTPQEEGKERGFGVTGLHEIASKIQLSSKKRGIQTDNDKPNVESNTQDDGSSTEDDGISTDNNDVDVHSDESETESITSDIIESSESIKTCRICMKEVTDDAKNIFKDHLYEEVPIYLGMAVCIYPIEVSIEDPLTKYACNECLEKLASFIKFRNSAIRNDKIQRERIAQTSPLRNAKTARLKRNIDADNEFHLKKKKMETNLLEQNEPISESTVSLNNNNSPSPIQEMSIAVFRTLDVEQEGTILIEYEDEQTKEKTNILIVEEDEHTDTDLDSTLQVVNSPPNTDGNVSFCMVNGYLMEHKFSKENVRYLKCALSKCPAIGKQEVLMPGSFKNTVILIKPHNHEKPTDIDIKKQKIISVVRKKLQVGKGSTIKSVYDEVSILDPAVAELLPMKVLMAEICNL